MTDVTAQRLAEVELRQAYESFEDNRRLSRRITTLIAVPRPDALSNSNVRTPRLSAAADGPFEDEPSHAATERSDASSSIPRY